MTTLHSERIHQVQQNRKVEQDLNDFEVLIATPHDFGSVVADGASPTPLEMPANARLAISHSAALTIGDVTVDIGANRSFGHPTLDADVVFKGVWGEQQQDIIINRGSSVAAGTLSVYIVDFYGRYLLIGTATFA